MSKAVPWATLVRMMGRPKRHVDRPVHPQQLQRDVALVVIHGHHGVELSVAGPNHQRVGRQRPFSRRPSARPRSTAGRMIVRSSSPNSPPSPPCGFNEQTPIRGRASSDGVELLRDVAANLPRGFLPTASTAT